jgi:tetratricopeptide (TPR) repeat protein
MPQDVDQETSASEVAAWRLAFDALSPAGRGMIEVVAWLAPAPLPLGLFQTGQARKSLATVSGDRDCEPEDALLELRRRSLLRPILGGPDANVGEVNRLVQQFARERQSSGDQRRSLKNALAIVKDYAPADPGDVRTWDRWSPLAPHVEAVVAHADRLGITTPTAALMNELGLFYMGQSRLREAEPLYLRALAIRESTLGPHDPDVAASLNNLACLFRATNRPCEAEAAFRRALAIFETALGPDHPDVAQNLKNLALLLKDESRLAEAEPMLRRSLAIREARFGPDHVTTASALNSLAGLLRAMDQLSGAESLYDRALTIQEAAYGSKHPTIAATLNNLAGLLRETNRLTEAESMYRRALAIDEEAFGPDHPEVATDLANLAGLLDETNRSAEAESLYRRALTINEAAFGPYAAKIANNLNDLATVLVLMNRLTEAEPLYLRALPILTSFTRATGYEHRWLRIVVENYCDMLQEMGLNPEQVAQRLIDADIGPRLVVAR